MRLRTQAFSAVFGILVLLAAAYFGVLVFSWRQGDVLELLEPQTPVWRLALACWVFSLFPIWVIARVESRWLMKRVQQPIASLVQQCREIRERHTAARLIHSGRDDEVVELADAVNELLDDFNRIVVHQHEFAADAAHELRTPLTAQSVVAENALSHRCSAAELREVVGSMLEESKHMQRLIESLLELTRASAVSRAKELADRERLPLDLGVLVRGCVESLRILAEEKHQRIELTITPVWADADATMVRQALLNVIHNAIEHCPEGARIQVLSSPFGRGQAMLRVTDNGPGIPLDQQTHVFKRFYRGPSTNRRRSLGLGLSIAQALLKSQQGDIHLRSEPGAGCCFTLTLPRLPDLERSRRPRVVADADDLSEQTSS